MYFLSDRYLSQLRNPIGGVRASPLSNDETGVTSRQMERQRHAQVRDSNVARI
jgi:hypothetical protein